MKSGRACCSGECKVQRHDIAEPMLSNILEKQFVAHRVGLECVDPSRRPDTAGQVVRGDAAVGPHIEYHLSRGGAIPPKISLNGVRLLGYTGHLEHESRPRIALGASLGV